MENSIILNLIQIMGTYLVLFCADGAYFQSTKSFYSRIQRFMGRKGIGSCIINWSMKLLSLMKIAASYYTWFKETMQLFLKYIYK